MQLNVASAAKRPFLGNKKNVLNEYRSVTYNFTLAALKADALRDPKQYRSSSLDFVILKSGGKDKGLNPNAAVGIKMDSPIKNDDDGNAMPPSYDKAAGSALVNSFNKKAAGRFDFFIDNVEIHTIMVPTEETGSALATKVKFDVIEPYSMNGFIDALRVSAIAAGHPSYIQAIFLLKIDFKGYPDSEPGPSKNPETIDFATRYFPIKLTGVEVTVTEAGTRYTCTAVPYNEQGFSIPNTLVADIQMSGKKVGEILKNMFKSLNDKVTEQVKQEKDPEKAKNKNKYEIYFPNTPPNGQALDPTNISTAGTNVIADAALNDILTENNVFKFPAPESGGYKGTDKGTTQDTSAAASDPALSEEQKKALLEKQSQAGRKYDPDAVAIMFASGANIHDIIAAVIRDSDYLKNILKNVEKARDANGMVPYFKIHINTVPDAIESGTGLRLHTYQFIVLPYKIHYTKLPGQKFTANDPKKLEPLVKREYNYIYTGLNTEVTGFNLKFNTLYFQSANPKGGNTDNQGTASAAAATNDLKTTADNSQNVASTGKGNPSSPLQSDPTASSQELRAGSKQSDPFYMIAYNAHQAILESVDLIKGEMDILGDPYYLVTGGAGNYIAPAEDTAITKDGEANIQSAEPLIKFNFRNPTDFDPATGLMQFDMIADYSGIYRVIKATSTFKDGLFKQHLEIIRIPGQFENSKKMPEKTYQYITGSKASDMFSKDTAAANILQFGFKPNEFDLTKMLSKGLPSLGLPGVLSNVSNIVNQGTGLLGTGVNAINKVNQLSGFNLVGSGVSSTISTISSGARLAQNGLGTLVGLASMGTNLVSNVSGAATKLAGAASSAFTNVTDKIGSLTAGGDAASIANKLGIDTSQLSGLGGALQSKMLDQLKSATDLIPKSVDLTLAKGAGLLVTNLTGDTIKNIPASLPATVAPDAKLAMVDTVGPTEYMAALGKQLSDKQASVVGDITAAAGNIGTNLTAAAGNIGTNLTAAASGIGAKVTALGTQVETGIDSLKSLSADDIKAKMTAYANASGLDTSNLVSADGQLNLSAVNKLAGSALSTVDSAATKLKTLSAGSLAGMVSPSLGNAVQAGVAITNMSKTVATQFSSGSSPLDILLKNKGLS